MTSTVLGAARVLLIDGRGCHVVVAAHQVRVADCEIGTVVLRGQTWQGLVFQRTAERTREGWPVFRSPAAAIGPLEAAYRAGLYRPEGWRDPDQLADLLEPAA